MEINKAKKILTECVTKDDLPVMLWGVPGVGKSSIVKQVAASLDMDVTDVRLSLLAPTDFLLPFPNKEDKSIELYYPKFFPKGGRGIFLLDEINGASTMVQGQAYQLVLDRKLGTYKLPDGWAIVAAGNRMMDRGVTYKMPAPLSNRLLHLEIEPDLNAWKDWAFKNNIDTSVISFLNSQPQYLYLMPDTPEIKAFPSPRSWEMASKIMQFDKSFEAIAATVGEGAAAALTGFLAVFGKIPDPESILEGSIKKLPVESNDIYFAVAGSLLTALKKNYTKERVENFFVFVNTNFPVEFQAFAIKDVIRAIGFAKLNLQAVKGYTEWAKEHAEELI